MNDIRVLFILKKRGEYYNNPSGYSTDWQNTNFTGLSNSVNYIVGLLTNVLHIQAKWIRVTDNNDIDREVTAYKPTHVVIEALWVVPEKFKVLAKLHPTVQWIVRLHSELPFIAQEGMAMNWIFGYLNQPKVVVAANSDRMCTDLEAITGDPIEYLPNYYPFVYSTSFTIRQAKPDFLDIGCFGAIRPLKNQLTQAAAAIEFAEEIDRTLRFHINADRIESSGHNILQNLQALFANSEHQLIEHPWMNLDDFLALVRTMDIGMQVSFSESFNIVAADFVVNNVPVIVSPEIDWMPKLFQAEPTDVADMVCKLKRAWYGRWVDVQQINKRALLSFDDRSKLAWYNFFQP